MESPLAAASLGFAGGICAFPHCLAMCGAFSLHFGGRGGRGGFITQLLWVMGKFWSYLFLGALAGFAGGRAATALLRHPWWQDALAYAAGGILLLSGLSLLGLLPVRALPEGERMAALVCRRMAAERSPGAALLLGMLSGCLPCPVVVAFLTLSLRGASVAGGMATMAGVGVGTAIPLLLVGGVFRCGRVPLRRWGGKIAGVVLVVAGVTTALRTTESFHRLLGCPVLPGRPAASEVKPCCIGESHGDAGGR